MKYFVDDNTVIFSHIKNNILRCIVTREAEARNDSWLVQKNVYRKLHDRVDQKSISINIQSKEAVFKLLNKELFRLNKSILTEKDVVRYSTNGEEPQIEIVKTVDGQ